MNKITLIAIVCCVLPIVVIGLIFAFGGERIDHSTMPGWQQKQAQIVGTDIGNTSPALQLTDVDKNPVTKNALRGKPAIVWFTTSYCVPCQIGAKEVKKLDEDMGGDKFNVVMVFIDPRETEQDLRAWKDNFASKDWLIAFGNEKMIADYKIRYLDTQYLLDKDGVIRNIANSNVGYEGYKNKISPLIQ